MTLVLAVCAATLGATTPPIKIRLDGWTAKIEAETLTIRGVVDGQPGEMLVAKGAAHPVTDVVQAPGSAEWKIPDLDLTAQLTARGNHLRARFDSPRDMTLEWPRTGEGPALSALILLSGSGGDLCLLAGHNK